MTKTFFRCDGCGERCRAEVEDCPDACLYRNMRIAGGRSSGRPHWMDEAYFGGAL